MINLIVHGSLKEPKVTLRGTGTHSAMNNTGIVMTGSQAAVKVTLRGTEARTQLEADRTLHTVVNHLLQGNEEQRQMQDFVIFMTWTLLTSMSTPEVGKFTLRGNAPAQPLVKYFLLVRINGDLGKHQSINLSAHQVLPRMNP